MNMIATMFLLVGLSSAANCPVPTKSLLLYPEGQKKDVGITERKKAVTMGPLENNGYSNECYAEESGNTYKIGDEARIDLYIPKKCNGQMIVICPGGGYRKLAMFNEGQYVAKWCLDHNIAACVLMYRMPERHPAIPLRDVENAFLYCRAHARDWGVKQIGVMGFSAGGHLAGYISCKYTSEKTRPDFSVIIYPRVNLCGDINASDTRDCLLGPDATEELRAEYSMTRCIHAGTPPTILFASEDDGSVDVSCNSIEYFTSLKAAGIPAELHIFTKGGHGWGFRTSELGKDRLGDDQRQVFFNSLSRWLEGQKKQIEK